MFFSSCRGPGEAAALHFLATVFKKTWVFINNFFGPLFFAYNNETLQRNRRQPASVTLFFTTLPQVGGIVPVGRSACILWSRCRCLLDTPSQKSTTHKKVSTCQKHANQNVVQQGIEREWTFSRRRSTPVEGEAEGERPRQRRGK